MPPFYFYLGGKKETSELGVFLKITKSMTTSHLPNPALKGQLEEIVTDHDL